LPTLTRIFEFEEKLSNIYYYFYSILASGLSAIVIPGFWLYTRLTGHHRKNFRERLGFVPEIPIHGLEGSPRIWIHAASLGEVRVAESIVESLLKSRPDCHVTVSTMTEHGRDLAIRKFGTKTAVVLAPFDSPVMVNRALSRIRPHVLVFLETELWPCWLFEAKRRGVKICLLNGRISERSIKGYLKVRPFFKEVLNCFDVFSMISDKDAQRMIHMGARPEKIAVNGNAKYDTLVADVNVTAKQEMQGLLNIKKSDMVFVAGSTRTGEEEKVLSAYKRVLKDSPDAILIIVPRHIVRAPSIGAMIEKNGMGYQLRTAIGKGKGGRTEKIVIMDTFGELFKVYSVGTAVFCGASLVPLGGQNPMEPAAWGKVILYGPHMGDFLDAKRLLEAADASVPVVNGEDLGEKVASLFADRNRMDQYGDRARRVVLSNCHTAERHAGVIERLLEETGNSKREMKSGAWS
jgi:3-deoxy-D-manno-octulosonic-acid transferase